MFFRRNRLTIIETRLTGLEVALGRLTSQAVGSPIANIYPEPLATPLALARSTSLHTSRYFSLLDAGEAFIKYSWAIAASLQKEADSGYEVSKDFRQSPTLGTFVKWLRDSLKSKTISSNKIGSALQKSLLQENGRLTQAGRFFLEEYANIRNVTRGHSSSLPDGAYEIPYLRHAPELHDALEKCAHIQFPLIWIESANPASAQISYDVRVLVGPPPFTQSERIETERRLRLGSLYVWDRADTFVDLMSLLVCQACPVCNLNHTFFLEQTTGKKDKYHSYFGNHRCEIKRQQT